MQMAYSDLQVRLGITSVWKVPCKELFPMVHLNNIFLFKNGSLLYWYHGLISLHMAQFCLSLISHVTSVWKHAQLPSWFSACINCSIHVRF